MNPNPGVTIRQVDEKEKEGNPESVQVAQSKSSKMEVLLQALRQLTFEVTSLKQTQKVTATKPKEKGPC